MFRRLKLGISAALLLGGFAVATPATATASPIVRVGIVPPIIHVRVGVPICPGPNYVWVSGHYAHDRYGHGAWVAGRWQYEPPTRQIVVTSRDRHTHRGHSSVRTVRSVS